MNDRTLPGGTRPELLNCDGLPAHVTINFPWFTVTLLQRPVYLARIWHARRFLY
jgi:hypothetical protein